MTRLFGHEVVIKIGQEEHPLPVYIPEKVDVNHKVTVDLDATLDIIKEAYMRGVV